MRIESIAKSHARLLEPSAIQQCVILPIINGRNVLAQAPPKTGKTTAFAASIAQVIDTTLPHAQVLVCTSSDEATTAFNKLFNTIDYSMAIRCYAAQSFTTLSTTNTTSLTNMNNHHLFVGTPNYLLGLIRRNIITVRKIRTVVLDDIDKLVGAGMEGDILELYRYIPPVVQVVASATTFSLPVAKVAAKLQADPLQILVDRDEGISIATHFYITVPVEQRSSALNTLFSTLGQQGLVILCRDFIQVRIIIISICCH
jgi:superfamily II DNA/RNA helicase